MTIPPGLEPAIAWQEPEPSSRLRFFDFIDIARRVEDGRATVADVGVLGVELLRRINENGQAQAEATFLVRELTRRWDVCGRW